jgi:hypothetical protein
MHLNQSLSSYPVFGTPVIFRDNLLCIKFPDISVQELLLFCNQKYKLDFAKEQCGLEITSLEVKVSIQFKDFMFHKLQLHGKGPVLPLTFKDKQGLVDMYSLNAREVLKSYIPSAVKKCFFY